MPDNKTVTVDLTLMREWFHRRHEIRMEDVRDKLLKQRCAGYQEGWEDAMLAAPTPAAQSAGQEAGTWRDAIETAVQVLSHIEAGDDVFVGQASEAIAGLTAILHGPTIPPTFEQARDALCDALDAYPPKRDVAPVNGGERAIVDAAIAWADGKPDSMKACAALVNAVASYKGMRPADAQQVGGESEGTDWMWCYENPREAASEIDRLLALTSPEVDGNLLGLINAYGRACRRDGSPAWESDEGIALKAALTSPAKVGGEYLHLSRELVKALKRLSLAAQTSGGTAGRDDELMAAIQQAAEALSLSAVSRAIDASEQAAKVGGDEREAFVEFCAKHHTEPDSVCGLDWWAVWRAARTALSADGGEELRLYRWLKDNGRELLTSACEGGWRYAISGEPAPQNWHATADDAIRAAIAANQSGKGGE